MDVVTTDRTLKQAREALFLTQVDIHERLGFSLDTIRRMENGHTSGYSTKLYAEWLQHHAVLSDLGGDFDFSLHMLVPDLYPFKQGPGEGDE